MILLTMTPNKSIHNRSDIDEASASRTELVAKKTYRGVWKILADWFRVPDQPPTLPRARDGAEPYSFKPADGWLRYIKLQFWIMLAIIDVVILGGWLVGTIALWASLEFTGLLIGLALLVPALLIAFVPDVFAYVAIHLRYDTTWYVISDRSMRIRRGIWIIHETTITFENIQNVKLKQGPLQRFFGISNLIVETAGAGGSSGEGGKGGGSSIANQGIIEGIGNADELRALILDRLRMTRTTGLGDEPAPDWAAHSPRITRSIGPAWTREHLAVLGEIRDLIGGLPTRIRNT